MKATRTLYVAAVALLTACQQTAPSTFPPALAAGEHWGVAAAKQPAADPRFSPYAQQPELRSALARLEQYMGGRPRSASLPAEKLAEGSIITEFYFVSDGVVDGSPSGYVPHQEMLAAENAYLALDEAARIRLATEAMAAHLALPARLMEREGSRSEQVRSYDGLNLESLRMQAGPFFGAGRMLSEKAAEGDDPAPAAREDMIRSALFKRMIPRCMLEDIACNPALDPGTRCAAIACLRDICREGLHSGDGGWPGAYMVEALPLELKDHGLENALYGGPAWTEQE